MTTHADQHKQETSPEQFRFSVDPAGLTGDNENTGGSNMTTNVHDRERAAEEVLRRFHNCIERVSWLMVRTFEPHLEYEDAKAEASILVCVYAGLMTGRHSGKLSQVEKLVDQHEDRIQAILSEQLRLDLSEKFGREAAKRIPTLDIDNLPERLIHSDDDFESRTISQMLLHDEMRERYPTLCRVYLDDVKEIDLAKEEGVTDRAIRKRISNEKSKALTDPDVFSIVIPVVAENTPVYSTKSKDDGAPSPAQVWAWSSEAVCVECGSNLNIHRVKDTCSTECWNFSRGRRAEAEQKQWDYVFGYRLFDGDPRPDYPELYAYEGWTSWEMNQDPES